MIWDFKKLSLLIILLLITTINSCSYKSGEKQNECISRVKSLSYYLISPESEMLNMTGDTIILDQILKKDSIVYIYLFSESMCFECVIRDLKYFYDLSNKGKFKHKIISVGRFKDINKYKFLLKVNDLDYRDKYYVQENLSAYFDSIYKPLFLLTNIDYEVYEIQKN